MPADAPGEDGADRLLRPGVGRMTDILSSRHRRLMMVSLRQGVVESEADFMFRSGNDYEETERSLRQDHLPRLEEAGYIEWDRESGGISEGPRFDEIEPIPELIENHSDALPPTGPETGIRSGAVLERRVHTRSSHVGSTWSYGSYDRSMRGLLIAHDCCVRCTGT